MKITDKYVFFWAEFLSQWHKTKFNELGVEFNCCEQYMMYRKALLFKDYDSAKKILNMTNPSEMKQQGRRVKNFDITLWDKHKLDIVIKGNYLRFSQNAHELRKLMAFDENLTFVEASPYDQVWGIGLDENEDNINDPSTWLGENLLGVALTHVRNVFASKEEYRVL